MDELLTIRETAERLGVVYQRVSQLIAAGSLNAQRDGNRVMVPVREVNRYVEERRARLEKELASLPEVKAVEVAR